MRPPPLTSPDCFRCQIQILLKTRRTNYSYIYLLLLVCLNCFQQLVTVVSLASLPHLNALVLCTCLRHKLFSCPVVLLGCHYRARRVIRLLFLWNEITKENWQKEQGGNFNPMGMHELDRRKEGKVVCRHSSPKLAPH